MATFFNLSETPPESPSDGQAWIKLSNYFTYVYLNGGWRPLATGEGGIGGGIITDYIVSSGGKMV